MFWVQNFDFFKGTILQRVLVVLRHGSSFRIQNNLRKDSKMFQFCPRPRKIDNSSVCGYILDTDKDI